MKITYDEEVDALYIRLVDDQHQCRTVRLTDAIALDFGPGEELLGIEILDAKRVLGKGQVPEVIVDHLPVSAA